MNILPICDEQQYIFDVNEAIDSIPMKISYSMEFSRSFSPEELSFAIDKCIQGADVFGARCLVMDGRQYMEFLPYQKQDILTFHFSTEEEYHLFCKKVWATKINNREKLYYIFIYSIAGSYYGIHFSFNHLIFDGISVLLLTDKIQKVLLLKDEEVKWHPFSKYLDNLKEYNESEKYFVDKEFWENKFLEIFNSDYLFDDVIDTDESVIKELTFQTSKEFKDNLFEYCSKNNISVHILIASILAQIINTRTRCKRFYFEIPIGNRLGTDEKNSLGVYEIGPPFIFDFTKYNNIFELYQSVQKQSIDYYKHRNFDWNTKILSKEYEEKYGRYIPQFSFSYFCTNKKPSVSFATLKHHNCETDFLPMTLHITDYIDWKTIGFSYIYWENYFTDEEVIEIHKEIETTIANILKIKGFS
ncbi:condensation domain-containing protein [Anaerotignum propionicum]|uniref:condensation domain-containing protein n=1 Tax=Anaerotignum propionicum TaxID=28446 RepID=UPI0021087FBC|nr:condensation domain-containing protein [Anaerotignum propionicum]MCQ4936449.1 condensation domain-containing protein [Anaerotignum propionicum]